MYSIGEISKIVKISSDTLRYYDEIQLLNPDYINPSNNYRFYDEEQVKELMYILELKECGFNLEEIKKIIKLKDGDKIKKIFEKKKNDLMVQGKKIHLSIEKIENKLKIMGEKDMKEKILIVDDAAFLRMMVAEILTKNGYEFVEAVDGEDGVAMFEEHKPALTVMDIVMPKMDGVEAVKKIKELDGGAKIVMLSAKSEAGYVADSFITGAVDFIAKPFQADKLTQTVSKHLAADIELDLNKVREYQAECAEKADEKLSQNSIDSLLVRFAG